jgi:hypothetical protein
MTQEQLRMQMLAGIITEGQYKEMLDENLKTIAVAALLGLSSFLGINHLNHSVQRDLENGNPVKVKTLSPIPSLKSHYFNLVIDPTQSNPVEVDTLNDVITINTSDMSNISLKQAIRDKIKSIDPNLTTQSIKHIHFR